MISPPNNLVELTADFPSGTLTTARIHGLSGMVVVRGHAALPPQADPAAEPVYIDGEAATGAYVPPGEGDPQGTISVASAPRGVVYIDGLSTETRTTARDIPASPGHHEVRVLYDGIGISAPQDAEVVEGEDTTRFFRYRAE